MSDEIPCEMRPACSGEDLLRAPDWRYRAAQAYLESEDSGKSPEIPSDPLVQYCIRGLRAMRTPEMRAYLERFWPELHQALELGILRRDTAMAAAMDAYIMTGRDMAKDYGFTKSGGLKAVCQLYERLFMDLSGLKTVNMWINDFLFSPERDKRDLTVLRTRLVTYYGGLESGMQMAVLGSDTSSCKALMDRIAASERSKQVFDYMIRNTKLDPETYVTLMETAMRASAEQSFQERMRDREDAGSSTLEELAQHIEEGVRAFSQSELKAQLQGGDDPVNSYVKVLTEREQ